MRGFVVLGLLSAALCMVGAEKKYLNLPVKTGAPKRLVTVTSEGKMVRQFDLELVEGQPDWWAYLDLSPFKADSVSISVDKNVGSLTLAPEAQIKGLENLYQEKLRPQFHFSTRRGWINDPNGLVFYKGEYHLFYQHNPYGWNWGNMHWGHAVSRDLVHWEELGEALYPDELGTMFSGSAVVDENNTAGFQTGKEKALVAIYTAAGGENPLSKGKRFSQCIAYSNDRGRTWTKYEKNPVLGHIVGGNRDPKVFWYAPQNKWVMALYLDKNDFAIFDSKDLKSWRELQRLSIRDSIECPEFFKIKLEGSREERWVIYAANGHYLVGQFDGQHFTAESGPHSLNRGNCYFAAQNYNLPANNDRRILVPWGQINIPGMPFNQMMGLPVELKLKQTAEGPRLFALPVEELKKLRRSKGNIEKLASTECEFEATYSLEKPAPIELNLRGAVLRYDPYTRAISCLGKTAHLPSGETQLKIRGLIDRVSIDLFINDGAIYMPMGFIPKEADPTINVSKNGLSSIKAWPLKSIWK